MKWPFTINRQDLPIFFIENHGIIFKSRPSTRCLQNKPEPPEEPMSSMIAFMIVRRTCIKVHLIIEILNLSKS